MQITKTADQLLRENEELRVRLAESEATLQAIRNGEVDAIVVSGTEGDKIFTLTSAETPYRIIIEEMEEGAVTLSDQGTILFCNRRFAELVEIPPENIVGKNFDEFFPDYSIDRFNNIFALNPHGRITDETTIISNRSGKQVELHLSMCKLPYSIPGNICIIASDISELKRHQHHLQDLVEERTSELHKANSELKEINATKDKLFSIIAHDLRGPFTSLLGFSDLLLENIRDYDANKFEKLLYHLNSAAKNAYSLLENLLIWARSQNKQLLFRPKNTNISIVVKDIIQNMEALAVIKNVKLKNLLRSEIHAMTDVNMLTAIVRNLISNAIKFCDPGGIIEISAASNESEVEISVSDNGVGMNPEIKNNLFRAGNTMSAPGTAHEKGTGLGLLICKDFVEKHGGRIWVDSIPGKGSTFTFTLPHNHKNSI
jgi:PAS domain S-box-containing protein